MHKPAELLRNRQMRHCVFGLGTVLLSAGLMSVTGSMGTIAVGASALLMLTAPVVRRLRVKAK